MTLLGTDVPVRADMITMYDMLMCDCSVFTKFSISQLGGCFGNSQRQPLGKEKGTEMPLCLSSPSFRITA